ncbi:MULTISPECIES: S8 family peptidase [unclassified Leucobacter]|uniref:S8 family peptidase n=1 Tax=unclassified Leucobacter TaxID=2621730 RepID=UPI0018CE1D97|nr:S8/S53 family peptidase [Leucobacter sp. Ag1]
MAGFAAITTIGLLTMLSAPAVASGEMPTEQRASALWYAEKWFDFAKLRAEGATGAGVKIAVIDEAINPDAPELRGANITVKGATCFDPKTKKPSDVVSTDPKLAAHGTNAAAMIVGNGKAGDGGLGARGIAPGAEIWFYGTGKVDNAKSCKVQDPTVPTGGIDLTRDVRLEGADLEKPRVTENLAGAAAFDPTSMAARAAIRDGADVISVSLLGGSAADWAQAVAEAHIAGVPIVVGTANPGEGFQLVGGPWDMNGVVPVSAVDSDGAQLADPDTQEIGDGSRSMAFAAPGSKLLGVGTAEGWGASEISGTSYATPLVAGAIALGLQKHPEASASQVVQGLVRTTGNGAVHEPDWIDTHVGYGYLNPAGMLAVDLAQLPAEMPTYVTSLKDPRCQGRGYSGTINAKGEWECAWSTGPFPPAVNLLKAVKAGDKGVVDATGQPAWSPYSKDPKPDTGSDSPLPWVLAGIGVLVLAGAVVAVIAVSTAKRKRRQSGGEPGATRVPSSVPPEAPVQTPAEQHHPGGAA